MHLNILTDDLLYVVFFSIHNLCYRKINHVSNSSKYDGHPLSDCNVSKKLEEQKYITEICSGMQKENY